MRGHFMAPLSKARRNKKAFATGLAELKSVVSFGLRVWDSERKRHAFEFEAEPAACHPSRCIRIKPNQPSP